MVQVPFPYLAVELTGFCNLTCVHCMRDNVTEPASLSMDLYEKLLLESRPYHFPLVSFTGGEPTLHPHFEEILGITDRFGYDFSIVTNAWNFPEIFPVLNRYASRIVMISFSVDGAQEETHDRIRRKGSFRRVLQAMSVCGAKDIPFNVQMAVNQWNRSDVEALACLASRMGAKGVAYLQTQPTPRLVDEGLLLSPEEWIEVEKETARLDGMFSISVGGSLASSQPSRWYQCRFLTTRVLNVDYQGNLTFCCQLSGYTGGEKGTDIIGNLRDRTLPDLHKELVRKMSRFHTDLIDHLAGGTDEGIDYFPCWYCTRYFKKAPWLKGDPDHPWMKADLPAPPNDTLTRAHILYPSDM